MKLNALFLTKNGGDVIILYLTWLEVALGEGAIWPFPDKGDYVELAVFVLLMIIITVSVKLYYAARMKRILDEQIYLNRARKKGLTEGQLKIFMDVSGISGIRNPDEFFKNESMFEKALLKYISSESLKKESEEGISLICRDILVIFGRLYRHAEYKKPMVDFADIEYDSLIYFNYGLEIFYGKVKNFNGESVTVSLLSGIKVIPERKVKTVSVYCWRDGDGEYAFESAFQMQGRVTAILKPTSGFIKGREVRHSFISVFFPCRVIYDGQLSGKTGIADEEIKELNGFILKINEHQAVVRTDKTISFRSKYILEFEIDQFRYRIGSAPVSDRIVEKDNSYHYTFRFNEISENAERILKKFISENF